jgi:hypothetical protein
MRAWLFRANLESNCQDVEDSARPYSFYAVRHASAGLMDAARENPASNELMENQ